MTLSPVRQLMGSAYGGAWTYECDGARMVFSDARVLFGLLTAYALSVLLRVSCKALAGVRPILPYLCGQHIAVCPRRELQSKQRLVVPAITQVNSGVMSRILCAVR